MSNDLVLAPTRVLDADEAHHLGQLLAASGYFADAREAAQAAVKVMAGAELGLGPVASMRGVDIIKGEVSLGAGLVAALVKRSQKYDYKISRWDDEGCELVFYENGEPLTPPISFTHADAVRAKLAGGDNYQRYPRNMYFARAMTNGARLHCPDLFAGSVYTSEELGGVDTTVVEAPATPTPEGTAALQAAAPEPADTPQPAPAPKPPASVSAPKPQASTTPEAPQGPSPDDTSTTDSSRSSATSADDPQAPQSTPAEIMQMLDLSEAQQRMVLITAAHVDDAIDLDAAYAALTEDQVDRVINHPAVQDALARAREK